MLIDFVYSLYYLHDYKTQTCCHYNSNDYAFYCYHYSFSNHLLWFISPRHKIEAF